MPDVPEEPLSSEELLQRAREDYLTPPPRESRHAKPRPERPREDAAARREPMPPPPAPGRPRHDAAPEPVRPTDIVGTPAGFEPERSRESRPPGFFARLLRFRGIILPVVIFGGIFLFNAIDDSKTVDRLEVGDCLMEPDELLVTSIEARDCDDLHQLEVFATVTDPAGDDAPYPGDDEAFVSFLQRCVTHFASYVGVPWNDSEISASPIYPTEESWSNGERSGSCVLYEPNSNGAAITRTGSLRNAGR